MVDGDVGLVALSSLGSVVSMLGCVGAGVVVDGVAASGVLIDGSVVVSPGAGMVDWVGADGVGAVWAIAAPGRARAAAAIMPRVFILLSFGVFMKPVRV